MTATTIRQVEGAPASYPPTPSGLSTAAQALDADAIWQRIEAWIAWRFTERSVEWIVEGCGEWHPPLTPASIATVEVWKNDAWEAVTLSPSPMGGYCLPGGTYRFTGTVGGGTVPEAVNEAFRRLAEYMAARTAAKAGVMSESIRAGSVSISRRSSPSAAAQAMSNSGAGDLLRSYRRA